MVRFSSPPFLFLLKCPRLLRSPANQEEVNFGITRKQMGCIDKVLDAVGAAHIAPKLHHKVPLQIE